MLRFARRCSLFAFAASAFLWSGITGCGADVKTEELVEPQSGRHFRIFSRTASVPTRAVPVLVALHAYATDPDTVIQSFRLVAHAVRERGWLLVVPRGLRDSEGNLFWNASAGCCGAGATLPDDVAHLRAVIGIVKSKYAVDEHRIYAFGVSNGAFMAHRWACDPGGDLRAIVSISGVAPGPDDPPCAPSRKVSVLQLHGDADPVIRYGGGAGIRGRYSSVAETVATWRRLDACDAAAAVSRRSSLLFETRRVESARGPGATVELWTFEGGDHHLRSARMLTPEMFEFLDRQ